MSISITSEPKTVKGTGIADWVQHCLNLADDTLRRKTFKAFYMIKGSGVQAKLQ